MTRGRLDRFIEIGMEPPDWRPLAVVTVLCAGLGVWIALSLRFVDCANEAWSVCSTPGLVQLLVAVAGVIPALATLVQSFRGQGHPGRWFWLTTLAYTAWGLYLWQVGYDDHIR